jgi:hypothetical protein
MRHARTGEVQHLTFTGCVYLLITYFECFALTVSIYFVYVGNVLCKYGFVCVSYVCRAVCIFPCSCLELEKSSLHMPSVFRWLVNFVDGRVLFNLSAKHNM